MLNTENWLKKSSNLKKLVIIPGAFNCSQHQANEEEDEGEDDEGGGGVGYSCHCVATY